MGELRKEFKAILEDVHEVPAYVHETSIEDTLDKLLAAVCAARGHYLIDEGVIDELSNDVIQMHELCCKYCDGTKKEMVHRETLIRSIIPLHVLLKVERCKCGGKL